METETEALPQVEEAPAIVQPAAEQAAEPETQGDAQPEAEAEQPKPRGVQKRIDELTANWRDAQRERDYWRDLASKALQPEEPPVAAEVYDPQGGEQPLSPQAIAAEVRRQLEAEMEQKAFYSRANDFKAKVSDEETAAFLSDPRAPITREMAEVMFDADEGVAIAGYLARNPAEAQRIAALPPHKQALALVKAAREAAPPPRVSKAPAPVPTVGGRGVGTPDPSKMTTAEFIAWRNKQTRG